MIVIFFVTIFFLIVNRYWIRHFVEGLTRGKHKSSEIKDQKILDFIKNKTGLKLSKIKLVDTNRVWGLMAGIPPMPYMVISKDAYENFTEDEMQWLLLHEAGHYVLWHNVKMVFLQLFFIIFGLFLLTKYNIYIQPLILSVILAILFAIIYIQLARKFEYEANYFAISKMDNPKGLVNMYDKAKARYSKKGNEEDTLWRRLFNIWILGMYKDLVKKAKEYGTDY